MAFESTEQVAAWAEKNGGEEGVRIAVADGRFAKNVRTIANAEAWLRQQDEAREDRRGADERQLRAREVAAAEASAVAARDAADAAKVSAAAAKKSALWAGLAVVVAILAVIVGLLK